MESVGGGHLGDRQTSVTMNPTEYLEVGSKGSHMHCCCQVKTLLWSSPFVPVSTASQEGFLPSSMNCIL